MKEQSKHYEDDYDKEIPVSFFPNKGGTYDVDIFGPIVSPKQFSQISTVLNLMTEDDQLVIHLSSGGGRLDAVDALLHAMNKTEGRIHVIATGDVSSAATFILLAADSFELSEGFESTLHCGSLGYGGNFNEVTKSAPFQLKHMEKFLRSNYEGFLDESSLEALFKGQDIILDAEGWCERAAKRMQYFQDKYEQSLKKPKKPRKPKLPVDSTPQA